LNLPYCFMPDDGDAGTVMVDGQTWGNNQYFAQVIQGASLPPAAARFVFAASPSRRGRG